MAAQSILIVDGEGEDPSRLHETLQKHGYNVERAVDSMAALQRLAHRNYDLVIADGESPGIDGLELCERIRATINPDLPSIVVTRKINVESALRAVRIGVGDMLQKPVEEESLLRSVRKRLSRPIPHDSRLHEKLADYSLTFSFSAVEMAREGLVERIVDSFTSLGETPSMTLSTLQLCLDEMLHNAFIHGTLGLDKDQRELERDAMRTHIDHLLENDDIRNRSVLVEMKHNRESCAIQVWVRDMGDGFNPQAFLERETPDLTESTGRGLRFLQVLTEELRFENNGRTAYIKLGYEKQ